MRLTKGIKAHCKNWDFHRIAAVDRNIMRLAIFEMLHREDIPPVVSINEAVDIAKKFSTEDSGKFVNGILDKRAAKFSDPRGRCTKFADSTCTQFSDGTFTPEELVLRGRNKRTTKMPPTDYDSVEGCARAATACAAVKMDFIPSKRNQPAEHNDIEVHTLAIFSTSRMTNFSPARHLSPVRQNWIYEMVAALNKPGIPLKAESACARQLVVLPGKKTSPGRW